MIFTKTNLNDVFIIEPNVFGDSRGYFLESFNLSRFEENIHPIKFIQDNESKSKRGVLRGLHFQNPPYNQAKLVRCISGSVMDVVLDIRLGSPTYGKHLSIELSGENKRQLFVPKGFAHGFVVLSESATFAYKVDNKFEPNFDSGLSWDDSDLKIDWGISKENIQLSEKDKNLQLFKDFKSPFKFKKS